MKKFIIYIFMFYFIPTVFCFADETSSDLPNVIDFNRIPNLKGEKHSPDIIVFSQPGTASRIWVSNSNITSENYIDVYVAIWCGNGRIIWSDRNSIKEDSGLPAIYYESYLTRKQLNEFWEKYRDIEAWKFLGEGWVDMAHECHICVSTGWPRNQLNTPDYQLKDSYLVAMDFEWPTPKDYEQYNTNQDAMEAWLRLRHNILVLIPYRPKEVRGREKIDAVFYFPSHTNESPLQNTASNVQTDEN